MPSSEVTYWRAFFRISPFGPMQEDLRLAYLTSMFYNVNRKKDSAAAKPEKFFQSLSREGPKTIEDQIRQTMEALTVSLGGSSGDSTAEDEGGNVRRFPDEARTGDEWDTGGV